MRPSPRPSRGPAGLPPSLLSRRRGPGRGGGASVAMAASRGGLAAWLECACAVTFDLELGQALELVYPPDYPLTEKEKASVCFLAFPDSYSGGLGDTQFSFRFRRAGGQRAAAPQETWDRDAPPGLQSLILVSRLPYVTLFHCLLRLLAPKYFDKLDPCLEAVCSEIDQWPPPTPGRVLHLPVMGIVLQVRVPSRADKPGSSPDEPVRQESILPAPLLLDSIHELDLFRCFQPVLTHVQMLWELMLLAEPLVVVAPSPAVSSEMVLALTSCLAPLRYCCDYRPYFTIHDSEFREYTTRTQAPPNVVLGVTNPFFIKTLQHWPHLLRLGELKMAGDLPKQVKVKKLTKLKSLDAKPGLYSSYRPFLHKDKGVLKGLIKGIHKKRPSEIQSALLRRHLLELTQSFVLPLEQYLTSLMPMQRAIMPWKSPPPIRPFQQEEFLKTLEEAGPQLTSVIKGDWIGLYRRFFKSPNFDGWFRQRHREMMHKLEVLHLEAISEANIGAWMKHKSEVEVVDQVLKLHEKLAQVRNQYLPVKEETVQCVARDITTLIESLPEDLQSVLCPQ
ncbi:protein DENND6B isoform X2 [Paroedura picta]|uniref:protein DENND6B isoform X2 n=1 Tax=Paroedura picta TaxID=143630 RepID=UPI0040571459